MAVVGLGHRGQHVWVSACVIVGGEGLHRSRAYGKTRPRSGATFVKGSCCNRQQSLPHALSFAPIDSPTQSRRVHRVPAGDDDRDARAPRRVPRRPLDQGRDLPGLPPGRAGRLARLPAGVRAHHLRALQPPRRLPRPPLGAAELPGTGGGPHRGDPLVQPIRSGAAQALPATAATGSAGTGAEAQIVNTAHRVLVTATWNHAPAVIRRALDVGSLSSAVTRAVRARPHSNVAFARAQMHAARASVHNFARARATPVPVTPATPGQVYTGLGFDACSTPCPTTMAAWAASPYRAIGVYIGGANRACSQPNLTAELGQRADRGRLAPDPDLRRPAGADQRPAAAAPSSAPARRPRRATPRRSTRSPQASAVGDGPGQPDLLRHGGLQPDHQRHHRRRSPSSRPGPRSCTRSATSPASTAAAPRGSPTSPASSAPATSCPTTSGSPTGTASRTPPTPTSPPAPGPRTSASTSTAAATTRPTAA